MQKTSIRSTSLFLCARGTGAIARIVRLLACVLVSCSVAYADPVNPAHVIKVGVLADWPPFYVLDANDRPGGFAVDTFNAIASRAGVEPRYKVFANFTDLVEALSAGKIDAIANLGILSSRHFLFTIPVSTFGVGLFVRNASTGLRSLSDITGRIGIVRTNVGMGLVGDHASKVYPDVQSAIFGLLAGKVDGMVYPEPVVWHIARKAGFARQLREVAPTLWEVKRAIAVASDEPALRDRLNTAALQFVGTDEYRQIYTRWNQPPISFWDASRIITVGLILLSIVSALLLGWRYRSVQILNRQLVRQSQLLGMIDGVLISMDPDRRINYVNAGAESVIGYSERELLGRDALETILSETSIERARYGFRELLKGQNWTGELTVIKQDGDHVPVMVSASPVLDPHGEVQGFAAFAADLSGYKLLESQLMQAQRMEAMGRLAGGVAHDFNNLLTVIKGEIELSLEQLPADSVIRNSLANVQQAADSATAVTRRLLAFSRQQALRPEVLDPLKVITDFSRMLRRILKENIALNVSGDESVWPILVDRGQLEQAMMNLVVNANDAMPDGGTINVRVSNVEPDTGTDQADGCVRIEVNDSGMGIDESVMDRIFEPFFSTKPPGQGTGLGLSIVHGIVHQSGGTVMIASGAGAGTTITMEFPRSRRHANTGEIERAAHVSVPRDKSILVVEDQSAVRHLICRTLARDGCRISETGSPRVALDLVHEAVREGRPYDLVVTDYIMPEMTGAELAARVLELVPDLPVLYLTGYTDGTVVLEGLSQQLMTKPFSASALREKVREMLGSL